ncbi:MAG: hypothetical protein OEO84_09430 [Betaproteobacteria bacterium]|nr:hypothetical protein [Betaproteobacteria bacterium]
MQHSFLFREGVWRAAGEYRDGAGVVTAVDGDTRVRHEAGKWLSEGVLRVKSVPPKEHHNRYEIVPFSPGSNATHWSAENAALGALNGRFVIAGDAILSFYASGTGRYRGFESMQQKDAKHYLVRGAMLDHDKVVSTWVLELQLAR